MEKGVNVLTEFEEPEVIYATFWNRFWALLIDGLVLLPLALVDLYNETTLKNSTLIVIVALVGLIYKPFCEFKYGATIGKKAIKILVVNKQFQNPGLREAISRNIFDIGERVFALIIALMVFNLPAFKNASSLNKYDTLENTVFNMNWYLFAIFIIVLVEIICLLSDKQKRSLHDRIGETFVVRR